MNKFHIASGTDYYNEMARPDIVPRLLRTEKQGAKTTEVAVPSTTQTKEISKA